MKTLREQMIERIVNMGGEAPEYYVDFSNYDLLEDFESIIRAHVESEIASSNEDDKID